MNVNTHLPHYLCCSLFNQLLWLVFRLFPKFAMMLDSVGLDWSSALLTHLLSGLLCSPVQEEDEQKRLLVTVWNRAGDSR